MNDLIKKLEASAGPDRALDNEIWALLDQPLPDDPVECPARYTASLDAALTLVPEGFASAVGTMAFRNSDRKPWACYWTPQGEPFSTEAATPAIALCIAALKARVTEGK